MRASAKQEVIISFRNENDLSVLTNTDTFPTGSLFIRGAPDNTVAVNIENTSTGKYKATWVMGDYANGDAWELEITASMGGTYYSRVVKEGYIGEDGESSSTSITGKLTRLYAYKDQYNTITFPANGYDLDDRTLQFVVGSSAFNDRSPKVFGVNDTIILDADISRDNSLATLTLPQSLVGSITTYPWYLLDTNTNIQLVSGWLYVIWPA